MIQPDDGCRNALNAFMRKRDEKTKLMLKILMEAGNFHLARVFLEMLWTIEEKQNGRPKAN